MLTEPWNVSLFGGLTAAQNARTITRFRTHKTGALLAYLAHHPNQLHPREMLIDLFWQEADLDAGRISLRTALASLRSQLEPPGTRMHSVIEADRTSVRLNPEAYSCDTLEFQRLLAAPESDGAEALRRALELYRGELLPAHYEDWVVAERERLAELAVGAMLRLAEHLVQSGELPEGISLLQRAAGADPLREETHRRLMRAYANSNNMSGVTRQYEELQNILRDSLNARPDTETDRLLQELLRGAATGLPAASGSNRGVASSAQTSIPATKDGAGPFNGPEPRPHLPLALARFFGRERELDQLHSMLFAPSRLITVTGFGGCGKTRFTIEAALRLPPTFADRIYFVALADINDERLIVEPILAALSIDVRGGEDREALIVAKLIGAPSLLILDNFEQLLPAEDAGNGSTALIQRLLETAPDLSIIVTSRIVLGISGERELPLTPLPTPTLKGTAERLMEFASVQMFVDRAQATRPDFQVNPRNSDAVGAICHRLEGIPLAIELTAAWARSLTTTQILDRLESRFDLLVSRRRDLPERHMTLRATIEWSWRLLTPELQALLSSLSVFSGGWNLDSAAYVCEQSDCLALLTHLIESSLISAYHLSNGAQPARYRMLETVRDFMSETLPVTEADMLRHRLADWCVRLAEESESHQMGPQSGEWMDRLDADLDNLRASLAWSIQMADTENAVSDAAAECALRLASALWRFWYLRGRIDEGSQWHRRVLELTVGESNSWLHAKVMTGAANLASIQGDVSRARALHLDSLAIRRRLGLTEGIVISLSNLGALALNQGDLTPARELLEEALALARSDSNRNRLANTLNNLGNVAAKQRDYAGAVNFLEESLQIKRELGDIAGVGTVLTNLGDIAFHQGRFEYAMAQLTEALEIKRKVGDRVGATIALTNLGFVSCDNGELAESRAYFEESLFAWQSMSHKQGIANTLEGFARLAWNENDPERMVWLYFAGERLRAEMSYPLTSEDLADRTRLLAVARDLIGDVAFASCKLRGSQIDLESAITCALDRSAHGIARLAV